MIHVACHQVSKRFTNVRTGQTLEALHDLDFDIQTDEIVTLLGPSGCGKSTLLNLVAGFDEPTSGSILVGGQPVTGPGPDRGVVFQEDALFPWLTVEQNIGYGLKAASVEPKLRKETVSELVGLVGLRGFEDRYPHELSGGMRQRVGIARVLALGSKMLLMDEPFAALDAQTRTLLQDELLRLWGIRPQPIVFVTHNIEESVLLGHRVVIMSARPGRVVDTIAVDLPFPRDVMSPEFNAYRRRATELIRAQVGRMLEATNPKQGR